MKGLREVGIVRARGPHLLAVDDLVGLYSGIERKLGAQGLNDAWSEPALGSGHTQ